MSTVLRKWYQIVLATRQIFEEQVRRAELERRLQHFKVSVIEKASDLMANMPANIETHELFILALRCLFSTKRLSDLAAVCQ